MATELRPAGSGSPGPVVMAAVLSNWREAFLRGGDAALKGRPNDDRQRLTKRLEAKLGQISTDNEVLREDIARM